MTKKTPEKSNSSYVAVVYFHGMGSQRRYEETSRLIDSIDAYSNQYRDQENANGYLVGVKPKIERNRLKNSETISYIRTIHLAKRDTNSSNRSEVRYYEAYWANVMADASSAKRVAFWILRQSIRPLQMLRSVWRERQRIRRAALADLQSQKKKWPKATKEGDFDILLRLYAAFDTLSAKRKFETGSFSEFKTFLQKKNENLKKKNEKDPQNIERLQSLADKWQQHHQLTEVKNTFSVLTILLAILLSFGVLVWSAIQLQSAISKQSLIPSSKLFGSLLPEILEPSIFATISLLASLFVFLGLGKFLSDYMGDVEAWSTYEETDEKNLKRQRVINLSANLLKHVLTDDRCERVVVVSHSLGTSIAHDTLLYLARQNKASNSADPISGPIRLDKIRHFVTMGSPIDKISYFFESHQSSSHRYARVVAELRGDISDVPFSRNNKPYVHWINYWDEADIVSGSLQSPVGRTRLTHKVDNVHVANLNFPLPGKSHTSYFNNKKVISDLFKSIYLNDFNFANAPMGDKGLDYQGLYIGPGANFGHRWPYSWIAVALPWIGLLILVANYFGAVFIAKAALLIFLFQILFLVGSWLTKWKIYRNPL